VLGVLDGSDLGHGSKSFNETSLKAAWLACMPSRDGTLLSEYVVGESGKIADLVACDRQQAVLYEFKYIPLQFMYRATRLPPPPEDVESLEYRAWMNMCLRALGREVRGGPIQQWRVHAFVNHQKGWYEVEEVAEDALIQAAQNAREFAKHAPPDVGDLNIVAVIGVGKWVYVKEGFVANNNKLNKFE
jgi:hypothetical protein